MKEYVTLVEAVSVVDTGSIEVLGVRANANSSDGSEKFTLRLSREISSFELPGMMSNGAVKSNL